MFYKAKIKTDAVANAGISTTNRKGDSDNAFGCYMIPCHDKKLQALAGISHCREKQVMKKYFKMYF
jgi:hypothetical protein